MKRGMGGELVSAPALRAVPVTRRLLFSASDDRTVRIWSLVSVDHPLCVGVIPQAHESPVLDMMLLPSAYQNADKAASRPVTRSGRRSSLMRIPDQVAQPIGDKPRRDLLVTCASDPAAGVKVWDFDYYPHVDEDSRSENEGGAGERPETAMAASPTRQAHQNVNMWDEFDSARSKLDMGEPAVAGRMVRSFKHRLQIRKLAFSRQSNAPDSTTGNTSEAISEALQARLQILAGTETGELLMFPVADSLFDDTPLTAAGKRAAEKDSQTREAKSDNQTANKHARRARAGRRHSLSLRNSPAAVLARMRASRLAPRVVEPEAPPTPVLDQEELQAQRAQLVSRRSRHAEIAAELEATSASLGADNGVGEAVAPSRKLRWRRVEAAVGDQGTQGAGDEPTRVLRLPSAGSFVLQQRRSIDETVGNGKEGKEDEDGGSMPPLAGAAPNLPPASPALAYTNHESHAAPAVGITVPDIGSPDARDPIDGNPINGDPINGDPMTSHRTEPRGGDAEGPAWATAAATTGVLVDPAARSELLGQLEQDMFEFVPDRPTEEFDPATAQPLVLRSPAARGYMRRLKLRGQPPPTF